MKARRFAAIARKVLRGVRRDRRSIVLMVVAPLLAMAIFGYVFGAEIQHVPVAVVNEDQGTGAQAVLSAVNTTTLDLRSFSSWSAAKGAVANGTVHAALFFPANFTADSSPGMSPAGQPIPPKGAHLVVDVDGSNQRIATTILHEVGSALTKALSSRQGGSPVHVDTSYAYAANAQYIDFFVPGILVFAALLFTMLLTLLAFVGERTSGTLDRLFVTPVSAGDVVGGYALAFGVVGIVQGSILLGVALYLFHVLVVGSLLLVYAVVLLTVFMSISLGILLSSLADRESQAVQIFPPVVLLTFLLSGIFVPVEELPRWIQPLAYVFPPTYGVLALRDVMLRGWGLDRVGAYVAILLAFVAGFLVVATLALRRTRARA